MLTKGAGDIGNLVKEGVGKGWRKKKLHIQDMVKIKTEVELAVSGLEREAVSSTTGVAFNKMYSKSLKQFYQKFLKKEWKSPDDLDFATAENCELMFGAIVLAILEDAKAQKDQSLIDSLMDRFSILVSIHYLLVMTYRWRRSSSPVRRQRVIRMK